MLTVGELAQKIASGAGAMGLEKLYLSEKAAARGYERAVKMFKILRDTYSPAEDAPAAVISAPGRTEIGGNHTDHQHGHVLCASVDMDIIACAAVNGLDTVRMLSEGYPPMEISLGSLDPAKEEEGTSQALIRGVAARIKERGYALKGFDICMTSDIPSGSGLSSSAAFEVLIGQAFNRFCCSDALDSVEIAKIGQYAEYHYFGKPCGLMDQMACSVGGALSIDFADPSSPAIRRIGSGQSGGILPRDWSLCIIDTRSGHDDLTADYAAITKEMGAVAAHFGKSYLRDVPETDFLDALPAVRKECGDRAVLRAMHFFEDDRRAVQEADALERGDFKLFLALVNASGLSSALKLQNSWSPSAPAVQPVSVAMETARKLIAGAGVVRVHGGGFAGTIQAFIPDICLETLVGGMEKLLGGGCCHILHIRPAGGCVVC